MNVSVVLFPAFETLDVFGPVEVFGKLPERFHMRYFSLLGGPVKNDDGIRILSFPMSEAIDASDVLFLPGGMGTRTEVENRAFLELLSDIAFGTEHILSVCTGSALLARAGVLDGKSATSNKRAFEWVRGQGPRVQWVKKARWVRDGNIWTSSGISAGIDMALAFVASLDGEASAKTISDRLEYRWNADASADEFADLY